MDGCCLILTFTVSPLFSPTIVINGVEASFFRFSLFLSILTIDCFFIFATEYAFS